MKSCSIYENEDMRLITGDTLRPGGFILTDKAVKICDFKPKDKILDIGCGIGETVNRLNEIYSFDSYGIDPSHKLLHVGKSKYKNLKLIEGRGEELSFEESFFNGAFAECTMSLMEDYKKTASEAYRVLKNGGYFIISDVYARKPEYINELQQCNINSCMRGLLNLEEIKSFVQSLGFEVVTLEDYTDYLKSLMVKIIFKYGSMARFWGIATCSSCTDFQQKLTLCKPGYFLMILKK